MIEPWKRQTSAPELAARALLAIAVVSSSLVHAQRVQLPPSSTTAPVWGAPVAPAPTSGLPAPSFDAYSSTPVSPPIYTPPAGPPPAAVPYSYSAPTPYAAPSAPAYSYEAPPGSPGFSTEQSPLGWQPGTYGYEQNDGSVTRFRQFLARFRFEHTYLMADSASDSMALNRTELSSTFAWPVFGSLETPLLITPGFAFNWFDGPTADPGAMPRGPDMPPRVYDAYLDFAWNPRFSPELGAELGFRTGVWTDFQEVNDDSVRLLGRGLGVVSVTPQFEFLLGAVYLDRLRVKMLPAGGVRWRPSPLWDLYLVFPNPKIRRQWFSSATADWWWYAAAEYGGGSWTFERADFGDRGDYNDIRILFGVEWQTPTQATGHLEIGYVFDRELRFESGMPSDAKLDDAIMFRAGIGF